MTLGLRRAIALPVLLLAFTASGCLHRKKAARVRPPHVPASTRPGGPSIAALPGEVEYGYASWYGNPYHGRKTSSGAIYDMYALTAAHRTLPFGTEVEVTNMENGRKVRVRINDRGPFVEGRIIDLSLNAARQINLVGAGTALVSVKVLETPGAAVAAVFPPTPGAVAAASPPEPTRPAVTGGAAVPGRYTVQVGAFADRRNAERLRDELARRYPQFPVNTSVSPDGTRHRVWVGNEPTEDRAGSIAEQLRQERLSAFVVRLD